MSPTKPIFPELRIVRAALSPGFLFRDNELLRDGNDSLEFIVAQSQELNVTHQGREVRLGPGDATVMQASVTGRVGSREGFGFLEVLISSEEWKARSAGDTPHANLIARNSDVLKLVCGYIRSVEKTSVTTSIEGREIARRHILDLLAVAAAPHESIGESGLSAVAAAHTRAIFDHLAQHFSDPELSLTKVAQNLHISPRYVQRLLAASETSFTEHVTELRLKYAFMLLTAQPENDVRICNVALQAGFFGRLGSRGGPERRASGRLWGAAGHRLADGGPGVLTR
jgi:AraC-like DNA-binding protein